MAQSVRAMPVDALLEIGENVVVTAAAQVGAIIDLHNNESGYGKLSLVMNVTAITIVDEIYEFVLQGSNNAAFTGGGVSLGAYVGLYSVAAGLNAATAQVGRYIIDFDNQHTTSKYRYIRLVASAVSGSNPSATVTAYLSEPIIGG